VNRFHRYYCASRGWARLVQTSLVPAVLEGTELGRRVLEIGPGPGLTTEVLAGTAPELAAIEIDPTLARATRHRVPAARVVQGDATRMPFADGTFSAVVCLTMLHHLPFPELQDRLFAESTGCWLLAASSAAPTTRVGASSSASSTWATTGPSSIPPPSEAACAARGSSRRGSAPDHGSCSTLTARARSSTWSEAG
jgi:hypothetical protein